MHCKGWLTCGLKAVTCLDRAVCASFLPTHLEDPPTPSSTLPWPHCGVTSITGLLPLGSIVFWGEAWGYRGTVSVKFQLLLFVLSASLFLFCNSYHSSFHDDRGMRISWQWRVLFSSFPQYVFWFAFLYPLECIFHSWSLPIVSCLAKWFGSFHLLFFFSFPL